MLFSYLPLSWSLAAPKASCFCHFGQVKWLQLELRRRRWRGNKEQRKASRPRAITPETRAALEAFGCSISLKWIPALDTYLFLFLCTNKKSIWDYRHNWNYLHFISIWLNTWQNQRRYRKANQNVKMWHQYTFSFTCKDGSPSQPSNIPSVHE